MADSIVPVKAHMTFVTRQIERFEASGDMEQAQRWAMLKDAIQSVIDETIQLRELTRPVPSSYGDVSDLPPTLH